MDAAFSVYLSFLLVRAALKFGHFVLKHPSVSVRDISMPTNILPRRFLIGSRLIASEFRNHTLPALVVGKTNEQ